MLRLTTLLSPSPASVEGTAKSIMGNQMFSKETRLAAIHNLTTVVTEDSALLEGVVLAVLKASGSKDVCMEWIGTNAMDSLVLRCPASIKKVLMGQNTDESIKRGAMHHLGRLFSLYPEDSKDVLALMLLGCKDVFPEVREAAVSQLSAAFTACPESARKIVDAVLEASTDVDWLVNVASASQFLVAVEACPQRTEEVVLRLILAVGGVERKLVEVALQQLPKVAKASPDWVAVLATVFRNYYQDGDWKMKAASCKGFLAAKQTCPPLREEIIEAMLRDGSHPQPEVRAEVVKGLGELITRIPDVDDRLTSILFRACDDEHNLVRAAAMSQLVTFAKEIPRISDLCARALLKGCGDQSRDVKWEAVHQLRDAAHAWPRRVAEILHRVLLRRQDELCGRDVAGEQLGTVASSRLTKAIDLLSSMADQVADKRSRVVGSKRKSCDDPHDATRKRRLEDEGNAGTDVSKRKNGGPTSSAESNKRPHEDGSQDSERKGPRRC